MTNHSTSFLPCDHPIFYSIVQWHTIPCTRSRLVLGLVSYPVSSRTHTRLVPGLVPGLVLYPVLSRTWSRLVPGLVSYPVSSLSVSIACYGSDIRRFLVFVLSRNTIKLSKHIDTTFAY